MDFVANFIRFSAVNFFKTQCVCVTQRWPLHNVIKRSLFTFIFAVFRFFTRVEVSVFPLIHSWALQQ